jgi:hypothetical protein
MSFQNVGGI